MCKLFDVFTLYSVGLIYLMWHAFEHVTIFKPVTSRPANSERCVPHYVSAQGWGSTPEEMNFPGNGL